MAFGPVIEPMSAPEPRFLTEQPVKIYQEGRFNKVPLIITVNEMEGLTLSALRNFILNLDVHLKITTTCFN